MNKKKIFFISSLSFIIGIIITSIVFFIFYKFNIKNIENQIQNQVINTSNAVGNENKISFDWLENSGESEAIEYEAYNSAINYLKELDKKPTNKPKAIILDIDETCLNNAPFEGYEIENNNGTFNFNTWTQWVNFAEAAAIPGAVQFTQEAKKDGFQVFYVSGRSPSELNATVKNLENCGFADASQPGHVILYSSTQNGKESTFNEIEKNYDVEMFIGDQLTDMGSQFQSKTNKQEKELVTKIEKDWGTKYIVIPNSIYGNYINAIYNYKGSSPSEELKDINSGIETFNPKTGEISYS